MLGLDWMKKLGIKPETGETVPQIQQKKRRPRHNVIENEVQKTVHRKPYAKRTGSKDTTKRRREIDTTERKANTDSPSTFGGKGNRKTNKTRTHRKSQQHQRKLLCKPSRTFCIGALLTGALLTGALLTGALLTGALLTGALLTGALLIRALITV